MLWAGIDVGARRKGFHVCAIDEAGLVAGVDVIRGERAAEGVVEWITGLPDRPRVIAIDAPSELAPPGATRRPGEAVFQAKVCSLYPTPSPETFEARLDSHYEWIREGLDAWRLLRPSGIELVECFPTASWLRWHGPKQGRSRAAWSTAALAEHGLEALPERRNQDVRDAIGAALTARAWSRGEAERIGCIVVPFAPVSA